jgi:hypothetical protein
MCQVWAEFVTHVINHNKLRINKLAANTTGLTMSMSHPPDATCHAVTTDRDQHIQPANTMFDCHTHVGPLIALAYTEKTERKRA